jgi:hypothetical protein
MRGGKMRTPVRIPFKYEKVDDNTERAKVIGGWIVKTTEDVFHVAPDWGDASYFKSGWDWRISTCFVPDPNHEWEL